MNKYEKVLKIYEGLKEEILDEAVTVQSVQKKADTFKKKLLKSKMKENFGQKEVRQLEDFANIWMIDDYQDRLKVVKIINDFNEWAMNYTGK